MIALNKINKRHGNQVLFVDASMQLDPGEKVGLVGPNGAGKSTIFRLITGEDHPDDGDVSLPKRVTIGHFRQEQGEMSGRSVLDEVIIGCGKVGELHHENEKLEAAMADPDQQDKMESILQRYGEVQEQYAALGGYELAAKAKEILHGLGFRDEMIAGDVGGLSGGWKMRVGMAKVLLGDFDVLLMDEPTNHLDIESILWLEQFLKDTRSAVLMTCHDKDFMNRVVKRIIDIDDGVLRDAERPTGHRLRPPIVLLWENRYTKSVGVAIPHHGFKQRREAVPVVDRHGELVRDDVANIVETAGVRPGALRGELN
jgi:ATPase subunit of ABC transporter with duplicated ATPase domains